MGLVVDNVSMITVCTILGLEGPVAGSVGVSPNGWRSVRGGRTVTQRGTSSVLLMEGVMPPPATGVRLGQWIRVALPLPEVPTTERATTMNYIYVTTIVSIRPTGRSAHGAYSTREEAHAAGERGAKEISLTQALHESDVHYDILPVVDHTKS